MLDVLTAHPDLYRWISATLGFLAAFTHLFRLVTCWAKIPPVMHVWGIIILAFSTVCSLGQARAINLNATPSEFTLAVGCVQLAVIVGALIFPWLLARPERHPAPLRA